MKYYAGPHISCTTASPHCKDQPSKWTRAFRHHLGCSGLVRVYKGILTTGEAIVIGNATDAESIENPENFRTTIPTNVSLAECHPHPESRGSSGAPVEFSTSLDWPGLDGCVDGSRCSCVAAFWGSTWGLRACVSSSLL
jgi:hypothetical protein